MLVHLIHTREELVSASIDLATAQEALESQPFSRLLQARITEFGDSVATIEIDIRKELCQQNGYVHGGVLSYAADNAITFAAATALGPTVLTNNFSIEYMRPAAGLTLRARATVMHAGKRRAVVDCDLFTVDSEGVETLCAIAQGAASSKDPTS